jgi:hypothetical protein
MAITNIRQFTNDSSVEVYLLNLENPRDTGGSAVQILPHGGVFTHDMWIPWCNLENGPENTLFPQHHIAIWDQPDTAKVPIFCLWQDFSIDKNQVQYSTNGEWTHPGHAVGGDSEAGGDRSLVIGQTSDGLWLLEIMPYTEPFTSPSPVSFVMAPDGLPNSYGADVSDGQLAPIDFRINGVQNMTEGTGSDPWTVTMTLSHRNFSGPAVIPPHTTSHAFDGQPLTGHWQATLTGTNLNSTNPGASVNLYVI